MTDKIEKAKNSTREATPQSAVKNSEKTRKWCRRIFCIFCIVVLVPLIGLLGALSFESGQQGLLKLTDKMTDSLSFEQISGNLQDGLELHNIRYQSSGIDTLVEKARFQLDFNCLWRREICVEDISLQKTDIHINTALLPPSESERKTDSGEMSRIYLPFGLTVKNVAVSELALSIDNNYLNLGVFKTAATLNNRRGLTLLPTIINDFSFVSKTSAEQQAEAEKKAEDEAEQAQPVDWAKIDEILTPALLGNLNQITLPFDIHVEDIQGQNWQYESFVDERSQQQVIVSRFQLQADATNYDVELKTFDIVSNLADLQAQGQIRLNEDFPLNLVLHGDIHQEKASVLPMKRLDLELSGNLKNQTALLLTTQGDVDATLKGTVELGKEKMPLDLQLTSKKAQYDFAVANLKPLKLQDVNAKITGNLLDYQAEISGQVEGMGAPKTEVDLLGSGKLYQAEVKQLKLHGLEGRIDLQGDVDWQDGAKWNAELDLNKINIGAYVKDFPAVLTGKVSTSGLANSKTWQVSVPTLDLTGSVSQRPLVLKGGINLGQEALLDIPNLLMTYGENKLIAKGLLSDKSDFNLDINAPNLKGLLPDFSASLVGKAVLTGDMAEPNLDIDLKGDQIQFQDFYLAKFNVQGKVNSVPQIEGNLALDVSGFNYGDINIHSVKLTAKGNEKAHELQLRSEGDPIAAQLNLSGGFDRALQQWKGTISQTDIKTPIGDVTNNQFAVNYEHKSAKATISAHCWHNPDVELCFPQSFTVGQNGEIPFEMKKLDLNLVNKLTEQENMLAGILTGKGKFAWFADKPVKLDASVTSNAIYFSQKVDGKNFKLDMAKLNVNANLENNNLAVTSAIHLQNQGNVAADIKLLDIDQVGKLSGSLKMSGVNLDLINQILSNKERISGDVGAALTFAGDLNKPLINGSLDIKNMNAVVQNMPFDITDGNLALRFYGTRSSLQGYIQTPDSRLNIDGNADWQDVNHWHTAVRAKANEFKLDIPSMAKLKVSPNVEMKASPTLLELTGNVDIPWGRIAIESLPDSAVSVSSDEVILDEPPRTRIVKLATETDGMAIRSDLKINIGNDVNLEAYGLKTNLNGRLLVKQEKGQLGLYGMINLRRGRYASFGQDLLIRKGQISFNGLPSHPMLNIEAIRNPEAMEDAKVIAGVKVTGLADSPSVDVFSEPAMPQDQALSYLLTGRSLENSGEAGSGGSVGAALLGMGLAKSGKAVGSIGETFGIQDLNLGTSGIGDSSKVVVSGNLTPRLQVKYGVGLFNGLAEFTLRYRLLPRLYLQSVTGVNQAVDLLYRFEF